MLSAELKERIIRAVKEIDDSDIARIESVWQAVKKATKEKLSVTEADLEITPFVAGIGEGLHMPDSAGAISVREEYRDYLAGKYK